MHRVTACRETLSSQHPCSYRYRITASWPLSILLVSSCGRVGRRRVCASAPFCCDAPAALARQRRAGQPLFYSVLVNLVEVPLHQMRKVMDEHTQPDGSCRAPVVLPRNEPEPSRARTRLPCTPRLRTTSMKPLCPARPCARARAATRRQLRHSTTPPRTTCWPSPPSPAGLARGLCLSTCRCRICGRAGAHCRFSCSMPPIIIDGLGTPATGQHETPMCSRVIFSTFACAISGVLTHVL